MEGKVNGSEKVEPENNDKINVPVTSKACIMESKNIEEAKQIVDGSQTQEPCLTSEVAANDAAECTMKTNDKPESKIDSIELNGTLENDAEKVAQKPIEANNQSETQQNEKSEEDRLKKQDVLIQQISALEKQRGDTNIEGLQLQIKVKCEENEILKAKVVNLETELNAVLKKPNAKNKDIVTKIKKQHEELLTKAKGMIFDKTKMIKNQELQIEALTSQVASLKEVATITKDLLNIRNMEVVHLQERMECMDLKIKAEKERHTLMKDKMDAGTKMNEDLKKEYMTQLGLFKELRKKYEEKFRALEEAKNNPAPNSQVPENAAQEGLAPGNPSLNIPAQENSLQNNSPNENQ